MPKPEPKYPRMLSEEQKEKARRRTREYSERTGYAAQAAYRKKVKQVLVTFHPEYDADLLELLDPSKPAASQVKEMLRELISLRG